MLNIHWKDWCWSSNTLSTWWEELTHWKRPWCWERLKAGREWENKGWGGWMASPTQWRWAWASSGSCWWTGRTDMLQSMGSQRVRHDWETELNWTKSPHTYLDSENTEKMLNCTLNEMKENRTLESVQLTREKLSVGTISKQTIQLSIGLKILIDTSPNKMYRWQISIWKDVTHHMSSEKCKYIEILLQTWTFQDIYRTKFQWLQVKKKFHSLLM